MMNDLHDVEKILGNIIFEQSGLKREQIKNGISIRGAALSKIVNDKIYMSYDLSNCVIIFNLTLEKEPITEEIDDKLIIDNFIEFQLMIYGSYSINMANILKSRLETEEVRKKLIDKDINLINIDNIVTVDDIINETIWSRNDLSIHLHVITETDKITSFENYNDFNIEKIII